MLIKKQNKTSTLLIVTFFVFILMLFLHSCSYTQVKDNSMRYKFNSSDKFIIRTNQFQWFLRDYSVWDSTTYSLSEELELFGKRKYSIMMLPFNNDSLKTFKITNIETKEKFTLVMKNDSKDERIVKYELSDNNKVIISEFRKSISDDEFEHDIIFDGKNLKIKSSFNKQRVGAIAEITSNEKLLGLIQKEINFFTNTAELDIERIGNEFPDILFISASIIFDDLVKGSSGGFK